MAPIRLFVSGCRAPHLPTDKPVHMLARDEFIENLRERGGTPEQVLERNDLMEALLPALRSDFTITETYLPEPDQSVPVPITAFGGDRDRTVSRGDLEAWSRHSSVEFDTILLPGDHFFLRARRAKLLEDIQERLAGILSSKET